MTKMAAMPIYGKNPSKIFFFETNRLISRKLGVKHRWLKYFNVYINHDPVMTLTKFMARSSWIAYAFELGKLLKCHLKGKASRKLANGQNIEDSEKRKWPKGFICPCTGIKYHNIHTCLLTSICSRSQVSVYRTIGPLVCRRYGMYHIEMTNQVSCRGEPRGMIRVAHQSSKALEVLTRTSSFSQL